MTFKRLWSEYNSMGDGEAVKRLSWKKGVSVLKLRIRVMMIGEVKKWKKGYWGMYGGCLNRVKYYILLDHQYRIKTCMYVFPAQKDMVQILTYVFPSVALPLYSYTSRRHSLLLGSTPTVCR